jgi:hypothetical protein
VTLPIVDEITRLPSHADRADWLIRAADIVIGGYVASIRVGLEKAGFPEGIDFLAQRFAAVSMNRLADESLPQTLLMAVNYRQGVMVEAAKARDGEAQS